MGQKSSGNEHYYKEIVGSLVKSFEYLATLVVENSDTIRDVPRIKKLMDKDLIRFNEKMAELGTGIDLFNSGIENVTRFIRNSELGELEDIAMYLEKCTIPDFYTAISKNSFIESKDVKHFQDKLSTKNISRMLNDITDIACNDSNAEFLKYFTKSSLMAS